MHYQSLRYVTYNHAVAATTAQILFKITKQARQALKLAAFRERDDIDPDTLKVLHHQIVIVMPELGVPFHKQLLCFPYAGVFSGKAQQLNHALLSFGLFDGFFYDIARFPDCVIISVKQQKVSYIKNVVFAAVNKAFYLSGVGIVRRAVLVHNLPVKKP